MPVDKKDKENCEEMGTCEAIEALENRSEEEWTTAFIEHGIMHFVEWMEMSMPLQGQLTYIIAPLGYAAYWYLRNMNYRLGADEDYYSTWDDMDDEAGTNLWQMMNLVKTYGSASIFGLLGLVELVNLLVGLGELNMMIWGIGFMLIGAADMFGYIVGFLGMRKGKNYWYNDSVADGITVAAAMKADLQTAAIIDLAIYMALYGEMTNWLAAQIKPYYDEEKAAYDENKDMEGEEEEEELIRF